MDYIKIFANNEKEQEIFIQTIRIKSQNIGMGFGIGKYAMLILKKKRTREITEKNWPLKNASKNLEKKKTRNIWEF